jgi:hypothetical protein
MPDKDTMRRVAKDRREGKSPSTQAGEFVREEIEHIREGRHGARSAKQAIAIGLSKARRAGIDLPPPKKGAASASTHRKAMQDSRAGEEHRAPSARRSRATSKALKREGHSAASERALSRQAHQAACKRTAGERSAAARKAAKTKGAAARSAAAKKAARTRAKHAN